MKRAPAGAHTVVVVVVVVAAAVVVVVVRISGCSLGRCAFLLLSFCR